MGSRELRDRSVGLERERKARESTGVWKMNGGIGMGNARVYGEGRIKMRQTKGEGGKKVMEF